jgi:hypothetical protein
MPGSVNRFNRDSSNSEQVPMHPDDFSAHLSWIIAKRCHEVILGKSPEEKAVHYCPLG